MLIIGPYKSTDMGRNVIQTKKVSSQILETSWRKSICIEERDTFKAVSSIGISDTLYDTSWASQSSRSERERERSKKKNTSKSRCQS